MKKILLTISYDGTCFCGWQKQSAIKVRTVQEELDQALSSLFKKNIESVGCSRTDSGVHALGQRATFEIETSIPTEKIPLALLAYLPDDLVVIKAEEVESNFHCRYDTKSKTYEYKIWNQPFRNPIFRNYSEFVREKLDILKMQEATQYLIGTHDFKAFCAAGAHQKTTIRTIFDLTVKQDQDFVLINVTGDGFLYNMVRILAGTLIMVGKGKLSPEKVAEIQKSLLRKNAGFTASAAGLTLKEIEYKSSESLINQGKGP